MSEKHEGSDIHVKKIVVVIFAIVGLLIGLTLAIWPIYEDQFLGTKQSSNKDFFVIPPEPQLQSSPKQELETLESEHLQTLHSYGWVNRERNIVHIPIAEAMKIFIKQNPPHRKEP